MLLGKVFRKFPRGGALARLEDGRVTFVGERYDNVTRDGMKILVYKLEKNPKGYYVPWDAWEEAEELIPREQKVMVSKDGVITVYKAVMAANLNETDYIVEQLKALDGDYFEFEKRHVGKKMAVLQEKIFEAHIPGAWEKVDYGYSFDGEIIEAWAESKGLRVAHFPGYGDYLLEKDMFFNHPTIENTKNFLSAAYITEEMEADRKAWITTGESPDGYRASRTIQKTRTNFELLRIHNPEKADEIERLAGKKVLDFIREECSELPSIDEINELKGDKSESSDA